MEGLLVFGISQWVFRRQRRPGLTTVALCMAYGLARFVDEFWREPDIGQPDLFRLDEQRTIADLTNNHCYRADGLAQFSQRLSEVIPFHSIRAEDRRHRIHSSN
jgi:hypothetical protein